MDDEPLARRAVARLLRARLGVTIEERAGGLEGLAALEQGSFAAAIIDLDMPGMGGRELLRELRARLPTLPVIVWSARDVSERSEGLGRATEVVSKMAGPEELLATLDRCLPKGGRRSGAYLRSGRLQAHLAEHSRRAALGKAAGERARRASPEEE